MQTNIMGTDIPMQTNTLSREIADAPDKQRTIEEIIEKNSTVEIELTEALSLLNGMEERLVGVREDSPATEETPNVTCHLPVIQQQQGRIISLTYQILSTINILRSHI